jgi:hypothetical protein
MTSQNWNRVTFRVTFLRQQWRMAWVVALSTFSAVLVVTVLLLSRYTPLRRTPYYVLLTGTWKNVLNGHTMLSICSDDRMVHSVQHCATVSH